MDASGYITPEEVRLAVRKLHSDDVETNPEKALCSALADDLKPVDARGRWKPSSLLILAGVIVLALLGVFRWRRYGWRNSRGFDLQHQELWRELLLLNADRTIRWLWVKGHSGHPIQSRVDAIAYQAARVATIQERITA